MKFPVYLLMLASAAISPFGFAQQRDLNYSGLTEGERLDGFRTVAVYQDDSDRAIGARFLHERTGFTLDLLQIQTAPQVFIWTTTYPSSNMGEPHTQEHLLIDKGPKGGALDNQKEIDLVTSTAFTSQWRTCYAFYTTAGADVFFPYFNQFMDALLHPDYSDEEIRREVRNFGVSDNNGVLHLEEKGTVYNEMVTSMDQGPRRLGQAMQIAIYGASHPLALNSGGLPADLRIIQPSDIRRFHDQHYFLGNMGAIAALPKEVTLENALAQFNAILAILDSGTQRRPAPMTEAQLPAPKPAPAGGIGYVDYPFQNDQQPGNTLMFWPADLNLNYRDRTLLGLFLSNVAGAADTNLYKRLIDSKTRAKDWGVRSVSAGLNADQGNPVEVVLGGVPVSRMNDQDLVGLRAEVTDEFKRIAAYTDGSAELTEFNRRLKGLIVQQRRSLAKVVNSPPEFGARNGSTFWLQRVYDLNKEPGFRKSVSAKEDLAAIDALASSDRNVWRGYLAQWKLLDTMPSVLADKPNPALLAEEVKEREARNAAETARLRAVYGVTDNQSALRQYQAEYDATTTQLEQAVRNVAPPKFLENPPMTLDDSLDFKTATLEGGVKMVASTFESMTSATTGIALRVDSVPEDRLVYLSLLPQLLTGTGVVENGKVVSYETMTDRLRNQILSLTASFSMNPTTGRDELVVQSSGNTVEESKRALVWMDLVLEHPNWRTENLPRIRDLVDQLLAGLRRTEQGAEETWVRDPATAYLKQDNPLLMTTSSFLTRAHNAQRLRWMLKDGGTDRFYAFLSALSLVEGSREARKNILAGIRAGKYAGLDELSASEKSLATEAALDLEATLTDLPDSSLTSDWKYLCDEMAHDLRQGPPRTLEILDELRRSLLVAGGARMWMVGSAASQTELNPKLKALLSALSGSPFQKVAYRTGKRIDERLLRREPDAKAPLFVGLLNANSQRGVFVNSAPLTGYQDTSRDKLLDYLTVNLFSGRGPHGVFSKTIAAGLAYSNGIGGPLATGRIGYYAERTPELPQTLKFAIGVLRSRPDIPLVDYAMTGAFSGGRAAAPYEERASAMAENLADGLTPEVIRHFRQAMLDLRKSTSGLQPELFARLDRVDGKVFPGMSTKAKDVEGAEYFVIGPEKQLDAWEQYLKTADSPDDRVWRLYPRDFWLTDGER